MLTQELRPRFFRDVKGQDMAVRVLKAVVKNPDSSPKSIILHGPWGTGKSTLARIFARALACESPTASGEPCGRCIQCGESQFDIPSYFEFDSSIVGNVEDMEAISEVFYRQFPVYKVILFDEAHLITPRALAKLLLVLENPPERTFFIFCSTHVDKILPTIRSRSLEIELSSLASGVVSDHIRSIAKDQGVEVSDRVVEYIVRNADGHMRDAVMLFDKYLLLGEEMVDGSSVQLLWAKWLASVLMKNNEYVKGYIDELLQNSLGTLRREYELFVLGLVESYFGIRNKEQIIDQLVEQLGKKVLQVVKLLLDEQMLRGFESDSLLRCTLLWFTGMVQ